MSFHRFVFLRNCQNGAAGLKTPVRLLEQKDQLFHKVVRFLHLLNFNAGIEGQPVRL
jgi:hypothetical protein